MIERVSRPNLRRRCRRVPFPAARAINHRRQLPMHRRRGMAIRQRHRKNCEKSDRDNKTTREIAHETDRTRLQRHTSFDTENDTIIAQQ